MQKGVVVGARRAGIWLAAVSTLSACGGGGGEEEGAASPLSFAEGDFTETVITGSVGDGPITDGRVVIQNAAGDILGTQRSNEQARYRIILNVSPADFPLTASVDDGTDLVTGAPPAFALRSAVIDAASEWTANLNPAGTLAVETAERMPGGLSSTNLATALQVVNAHLGFGLDARGITNAITADIGEQNVASMVRSSEALGETIRRALDALTATGRSLSADEFVAMLGADLSDGSLDGAGAAGADPRVAALTSLVSAQVLLETMTNRLEVGGMVATGALDSSIQQIMGGDPTVPLTGSLAVTGSMLSQSRVLVGAALLIDPSPTLLAVRDALALAEPGQSAGQVAALLPLDPGDALDDAILQTSLASDSDIAAVNAAVGDSQAPADDAVNRLPTISGAPATQVMVGDVYRFVPVAADADGDALTFAIANPPGWAAFDPTSGSLSGTPGPGDAGFYAGIVISVSDGFGSVDLAPFAITVMDQPNRPPTISGTPPGSVSAGNLFEFTPAASDPDGDGLSFSVVGLPAWAVFDPVTGRVSGVPDAGDVGVYTGIGITVSDGQASASLAPFSVTVSGLPNQPPTISGTPPLQVMVGNSYVFSPAASDADGDSLSFSIAGLPAWADFNGASGVLSGTPSGGDEGVYSGIRISVTDGRDTVSLPLFSITVDAVPNTAPTIAGTPGGSVTVGSPYEFAPSAFDADGDPLTFSIAGRPPWASFSPDSGRLSGTPSGGDVGVYSDIRISVSDGQDTAALPAFSLVVEALPNTAPSISGSPPASVTVGSAYGFTPTATDADGDTLSFSIAGRPGWASFSSATGALTGTPVSADVGTYADIRISVSDGQATAALPAFTVEVTSAPNGAPSISGDPAPSVTVGSTYSFTPTASDADGDPLSFSVAGLPGWAGFDAGTGTLSGVPGTADVGTYSGIRISVSDGRDTASLPAFAITVSDVPNSPPTISGSPPASVTVGSTYAFAPTATDADGDSLSFSIAGRPAWASFSSATGALTGTPVSADVGTYADIRISVSDGQATAALSAFTIEVTSPPNRVPTISGDPATSVTVGSTYAFTPTASDADGDPLSFSVAGLPGWAGFDAGSGTLSGVPGTADVGTYSGIRISVSDGRDTASLPTFAITVSDVPNTPPTIAGDPITAATVDQPYSFTPTATDADGDSLSFSIAGQPMWSSFDTSTGRLSGVPVAGDEGTYSGVRISVSDGKDTATLPEFTITVAGLPNGAPTISGSPPASVTVGSEYAFTPTASDPDGDTLSFSIVGLPGWGSFDAGTGRVWGTPAPGDEGVYSAIRISVSDGQESASLSPFSIRVNERPNTAPTIAGDPITAVTVGQPYSFTPTASDADGDALTFSIVGLPGWAGFDSATGRLSGTPLAGDEGVYSGIGISVSDGRDSASLPSFSITVNELPNAAPTIAGNPPTAVMVGEAYSFTPTASDADGDPMAFSIVGLPAWASFDAATGQLWGTPADGQQGIYAGIGISVSDGRDSASLPAFSITVEEPPNTAPTIGGNPPTAVTVGEAYSFTPTASDADGDALTFSIVGMPTWASFDAGTGQLVGTPAAGDEGVYAGIGISVSDGQDTASLAAFSITVNERPNQAPVISGAPATQVTVDSEYAFRPTASDADGDPLTFSIVGLPAWASFDTGTGRLWGTPTAGEEGVYAGIGISVSDGRDSASLAAFSITVNELPNTPPTIAGDPPPTVTVGDAYSFTPTAGDADGDSLSFSITGMPAWASFDTGTGRLSGTPAAGEEGVYTGIGISVSDGRDSASLPAFSITVNEPPNQPPTIAGSPGGEVTIGSEYSFTPTADDPDGDTLTFTVSGLPGWASFDAATGRLWGTPAAGDEATYSGIGISVSDGTDSVSLPPFSIAVVSQTMGSALLTWIAPTQNEDGSVLDDLAGFKVRYGTAIGDYPNVEVIADPTITTHLVENLVPGTWYFVVTAYDASGNESDFSNVASKIVP